MIELHIDNHRVDLSEDVKISLNYQVTDVDSPSTIRNSFSTSVKLKGTKNNNEIFGYLYRLESTSMNFDPTKRVPFELRDNGDIIESGYIQLNSIDKSHNDITYNITLYGGVGDFFYSLMYNDNGDEQSLKNIYFGWNDNLQKENYSIITSWNKEQIYSGWNQYTEQDYSAYSNRKRFTLTSSVRSLISTYSYYNYEDGVISKENTPSGLALHSTFNPVALYSKFPNATLYIKMSNYNAIAGKNPVIVFVGSYKVGGWANPTDVKMIVPISEIIKDTEIYGYWKMKLVPSYKYVYMTMVGTDYEMWIDVVDINSDAVSTTAAQYTQRFIDVSKATIGGTYTLTSSANSDVNSYNITHEEGDGKLTIRISGVGGTSASYAYHAGLVFLNDSNRIVGFIEYDIDFGDTYNLHYQNYDVPVPDDATRVYATVPRDYPIYMYIYKSNMIYEQSDIIAIPTYNGLYPDFDNNKVLVNVAGSPFSAATFPSKTADNKYGLYKEKYGLVETPRELVEWETRDLRCSMQRMGVKMMSIMSAICDPKNNGGYNVLFDNDIYSSPYFRESILVLDRPDFSQMLLDGSLEGALVLDNGTRHTSGVVSTESLIIGEGTGYTFLGNFDLTTSFTTNRYSAQQANTTFATRPNNNSIDWQWNGYLVRLVYRNKSGQVIGNSDGTFYYKSRDWKFGEITYEGHEYNYSETTIENMKTMLTSYYPDEHLDNINLVELSKYYTTMNYFTDLLSELTATNVPFSANVPVDGEGITVEMRIDKCYGKVTLDHSTPSSLRYFSASDMLKNTESVWYWVPVSYSYGSLEITPIQVRTDLFELSSKLYLLGSDISSGFIDKNVLFNNTKSPFKYLTDFTKMFNLKYIYNGTTKTIYITKNYYNGVEENLLVDRSKTINVVPTNLKHKYIDVKLDTPDTYANVVYKVNNTNDYGSVHINTSYEFNNDTLDIIKDNVYKNIIPYVLSSTYLRVYPDFDPSFMLSQTVQYTLFGEDGETNVQTLTPLANRPYPSNVLAYDWNPKMCMFSTDNEYMNECSNSLVFYADKSPNIYILSNEFSDMLECNANTQCYYYTQRNDDNALVQLQVPIFLKTNKNGYSFNVSTPDQTFNNAELNTITRTIYDNWSNFVDDVYNTNTKKITAYVHLTSHPTEAMRKFYSFDNKWWVISEVKNWCKDNYFTQITLISVNDKNNYINNGNRN